MIEVVSEATRRIDAFEKRDAYFTIESLKVYMLIEQSSPDVLLYRSRSDGFVVETYRSIDATIPLPEIGSELTLRDLYENVSFPSMDGQVSETAGTY